MKRIFYWFYSLRPIWQMMILLILSLAVMTVNKQEKLAGMKEFSYLVLENVKVFSSYFQTNTELKRENERLKRLLVEEKLEKNRNKSYLLENLRLRHLLKLKAPEHYRFVFARVIGNSPYPGLKGLIIDKGKEDSLRKNDIVISAEGLVGKVLEVYSSTSLVQILSDRNIRVAASILRNRERGILRFYDNSLLLLDYVIKSVSVKPGDIVVTDVTSQIYTEGLKIGKVVKVEKDPTEHFQRIYVMPAVNYHNLTEVVILKKIKNGH